LHFANGSIFDFPVFLSCYAFVLSNFACVKCVCQVCACVKCVCVCVCVCV